MAKGGENNTGGKHLVFSRPSSFTTKSFNDTPCTLANTVVYKESNKTFCCNISSDRRVHALARFVSRSSIPYAVNKQLTILDSRDVDIRVWSAYRSIRGKNIHGDSQFTGNHHDNNKFNCKYLDCIQGSQLVKGFVWKMYFTSEHE